MLADETAHAPDDDELPLGPQDMERIVHAMLDREYAKALDESVPMLGDKTPRTLAPTSAGRSKVAEWLKVLENGTAKARGSGDPMASYDFTWMWIELGLADLRKMSIVRGRLATNHREAGMMPWPAGSLRPDWPEIVLTGKGDETKHSAMRLVDDLAARRILYGRPLATMPDVLLIDIPPDYASPSLPLGRYYPVIIETDAEYAEMTEFLALDRLRLVVPDLFDHRPPALRGDDIVFARNAPTAPGWPWLLICRWPTDYT
jgi:hypothetical protein